MGETTVLNAPSCKLSWSDQGFCTTVNSQSGYCGDPYVNHEGRFFAFHNGRSNGKCVNPNFRHAITFKAIAQANPKGILARIKNGTWNQKMRTSPSHESFCFPAQQNINICINPEGKNDKKRQLDRKNRWQARQLEGHPHRQGILKSPSPEFPFLSKKVIISHVDQAGNLKMSAEIVAKGRMSGYPINQQRPSPESNVMSSKMAGDLSAEIQKYQNAIQEFKLKKDLGELPTNELWTTEEKYRSCNSSLTQTNGVLGLDFVKSKGKYIAYHVHFPKQSDFMAE